MPKVWNATEVFIFRSKPDFAGREWRNSRSVEFGNEKRAINSPWTRPLIHNRAKIFWINNTATIFVINNTYFIYTFNISDLLTNYDFKEGKTHFAVLEPLSAVKL